MEITLKSEEGCQRIYEVKAPWDEIAPRFDAVTRTLSSQVRMPGFRSGKAPVTMVRSRFKKEIREEVLEKLLQDSAKETLAKFAVDPVVEPYAAAVTLEDGKPFSAEISLEVAPEVPELSAAGISIECPRLEVSEEQIDRALEGIRERASFMKPLEGAAEEGDFAMVVLTRKGQAKGLERFFGALPKSDHPVEQALLGKKTGDEFELQVEAQAGHEGCEDPNHRHLAPGEYSVKVQRVARREIPELNDDLAKDVGAENLEDLKAKMREDLAVRAQGEMRAHQENKLIEALAVKYPFPVPVTQVDRQVRSDLEDLAEGLSRQGLDVAKADIDWVKMADSRRPEAQKKVIAFYMLDAVARRRSLEASDAEVDEYLAHQAKGTRLSAEALKDQAVKDGRLDMVKAIIAHRKAADLLLSEASVTFTEGKAATQEVS